ncbi:hypothetical protein [Methylomonas fluvii]|uniref:hypothetical protein n=1 Tax=Methylomonas fluvii TaxID=1854564 RepID=UPI001CE10211|nr:hypothetical protein [Methylomonas fluvii]
MQNIHWKIQEFKLLGASTLSPVKQFWIGVIGGLCLISHPIESMADDATHANINLRHTRVSNTKLRNTLWEQVAIKHQLDPYILYAVALVESANSADHVKITPSPWSINKSGKSIISASLQEAQHILAKTIA